MRALDEIVAGMWRDGWKPAESALNTFTRDFGLLSAAALLALPNAVPVFRSERVLDHFSVYFPYFRTEYFPFHKALNALTARHGESFRQLFAAAAAQGAGA
jgi:hypothetical protein